MWAKMLEKAGCHVIYGLVGLKTHSKITLVVRREEDRNPPLCTSGIQVTIMIPQPSFIQTAVFLTCDEPVRGRCDSSIQYAVRLFRAEMLE